MAATAKLYGPAMKSAFNGEINWTSHTIKVMLCTSAYTPDQDVHQYKSSVTNEVTGTGYTAGGLTLATPTVNYTAGTNTLVLDGPDLEWSGSTITARYAVIYDATPGTDATRPLFAYVDLGGDVSTTAGKFTITWDTAGIITSTTA